MDSGETLVVPVSEFEGRVRLYWDKLSRTERQIAEYILKNEDTVSQVSVHTLAQDAGVGAASVIRFSKALGYQVFSEMKFHLDKKKIIVDERDVGISRSEPINVVITKALPGNLHAMSIGYPMGWVLCAAAVSLYYRFSRWDASYLETQAQ